MSDFVMFDKSVRGGLQGIAARIYTNPVGTTLTLSRGAYEALGRPECVLLGFDEEHGEMAVVASSDFRRGFAVQAATRQISVGRFAEAYNLKGLETVLDGRIGEVLEERALIFSLPSGADRGGS